MRDFRDIPERLLGPLSGRGDDAWFMAPPGKWCPGEIVDHVATAMENSARGFASRLDKPAMTRRPRSMVQRVASFLVLSLGWFPVRRQAPESTRPATRPDRAATEAKLKDACTRLIELEKTLAHRSGDLFLKHPVLGDLTIGEFNRFHVRHAEHHRKQVVARLTA